MAGIIAGSVLVAGLFGTVLLTTVNYGKVLADLDTMTERYEDAESKLDVCRESAEQWQGASATLASIFQKQLAVTNDLAYGYFDADAQQGITGDIQRLRIESESFAQCPE